MSIVKVVGDYFLYNTHAQQGVVSTEKISTCSHGASFKRKCFNLTIIFV